MCRLWCINDACKVGDLMSKSAYPELVEALSNFKDYGFTQLQASAYIAILRLGEDTGSAIAKESGINRSKIYDTLNQLEEMGAVKVISKDNRPRYVAVEPDIVFGSLLSRFADHVEKSKQTLNSVIGDQVSIDPTTTTITTLKLKTLDLNAYTYLITSNVRARSEFFEQIPKEHLPNFDVKILDLNDFNSLSMILLLNANEILIFPSPKGSTVDAIKIEDKDIANFFHGIIESWWQNDIPDRVVEEISLGKLMGLHVGKSLYMKYEMKDGREYVYDRPVSYLITDSHISFFYESSEDPKINLMFLTDVNLNEDGSMRLIFRNFKNEFIGELLFYPVEKSIFLKNLLLSIAKLSNLAKNNNRS